MVIVLTRVAASSVETARSLAEAVSTRFQKPIAGDRQLYCLIKRDILPAQEKRVVVRDTFIKWQCVDPVGEEEAWLRYYASEHDRQTWAFETELRLPPRESVPFPRKMPQHG